MSREAREQYWRIGEACLRVECRNNSFGGDHPAGNVAGALDNSAWPDVHKATGTRLVEIFIANARGLDLRVRFGTRGTEMREEGRR